MQVRAAKLLYSVTMSVNGFIAAPGGGISWLTEYLGPDPAVDALIGNIGAMLVGNRTIRGDDPHRGTPREQAILAVGGTVRSSCSLTTRPRPRCRASPSSLI